MELHKYGNAYLNDPSVPPAPLELSQRELREYSVPRLLRALAAEDRKLAVLETDIAIELDKRSAWDHESAVWAFAKRSSRGKCSRGMRVLPGQVHTSSRRRTSRQSIRWSRMTRRLVRA